jgi:hypothetical protein
MKQFYSCIDAYLPSPQPEQHAVISRKADKEDAAVVFYGAEEVRVAQAQPFILSKLKRTPGLDGVIFFSINQFCYSEKLNLKLIFDILDLGLSVHFAREDISLYSKSEAREKFIIISAFYSATKRKSPLVAINNY